MGADCGKKTNETPARSSTYASIDGGDVRSLRGRFLNPDGTEAESIIVEVYRNDLSIPMSAMTYVQVHQIVKTGRVAALDTDTRGRFCFKNLKAGNYMLRANVSGKGLSGYSTMDVFVTLTPKTKRGANRNLEITFEMAI
jgi:hypothetical protein